HPMSPQARDLIVGLRTDIAEAELDDDRRARFPWTFTASNGMEFELVGDGTISGPNPGSDPCGWASAVLELLAADTGQVATWRWPVDEHFVVIRSQMPHLDTRGKRWAYCFDTRLLERQVADPEYAAGVSGYCSDRSAPPAPGKISSHAATHAYFDSVPVPGYETPEKMRRSA